MIPTTLRPELARAVRSVFAQDLPGSIQILIGIDVARGDRTMLDTLVRECPERVALTVIDPGYSTSRRHGGLYRNWSGGALRTVMSYAANSPRVAYLDDDNWWAPSHLSDLVAAIDGRAWAWSLRWYVDHATQQPACIDRWESTGPGTGRYAAAEGGFVDTSCLMLDKQHCHWLFPAWCVAANHKGSGVDRVMFRRLLASGLSHAGTGNATTYYLARASQMRSVRRFLKRDSGPG